MRRQHVGQQFKTVHQDGDEGLHALDGVALGQTGEHIGQLRVLELEGGGAAPDGIGEQQLSAGFGRDPLQLLAGGALVSHREGANLGHLVAEEVDTHGLFGGGREDVDNAATHRELAASLHQVDTVVGGVHQRCQQVGEVAFLAGLDGDGPHRCQVLDLRLEQGPHRSHHHSRRRIGNEPPQHGQAPANGVGAGRESFVGQGFPSRVVGDGILPHQTRDLGRGGLGLPEGGGDQQYRAPGLGGEHRRRGSEERSGAGDIARLGARHLGVAQGGPDSRVCLEGGKKSGKSHRVILSRMPPKSRSPIDAMHHRIMMLFSMHEDDRYHCR